ncbi:MAG: YceI family protein [Gemmatimonadaceae bacterium]
MTVGSIALVGVATMGAHAVRPEELSLSTDSRLWLEGTSTVKSFKCVAEKVQTDVSAELTDAPVKMVRAAELKVPVGKLECGNGTMNDHLRDALKANKNPNILWKMTSYEVQGSTAVIQGKLTIAGKENTIELRGTGTANDGGIRFKGSRELNMKEFGVKPPSLMLGTMRVGEKVTVRYELQFTQ